MSTVTGSIQSISTREIRTIRSHRTGHAAARTPFDAIARRPARASRVSGAGIVRLTADPTAVRPARGLSRVTGAGIVRQFADAAAATATAPRRDGRVSGAGIVR